MRSAQGWDELRRGAERVPSWVYDTAIALAITAVSLLLGNERAPVGWQSLDGRGVLLTCAVNLPLAARRRAPVALCLTALAVWAVYIALDYWPVVNTLGPLLALYTVASLRPLRQAVLCALVLAGLWNVAGATGEESSWATVLGQSVVYAVVICGFGHLARKSARRNVELAELAEELREERAGAERRAVAEERVRIARELHDVVAHHMSVISVQAGLAGYVFSSDPATARGALGTIADTSGEALAELRRLLAVLRVDGSGDGRGAAGGERVDGQPDFGPAPGIGQLPELADRVRGAGVPVHTTVTGTERDLPPGVGQCVYRVVQEALTNVLKHAAPTEAHVAVDYTPSDITVTIADDGPRGPRTDPHPGGGSRGPGKDPAPGAGGSPRAPRAASHPAAGPGGRPGGRGPARSAADGRDGAVREGAVRGGGVLEPVTSGGHGLIGMRERARIYGGRLHAGPRASGGFEVRLILPA